MMLQDLREQIDAMQQKVLKLKRAVKVYAKRLKANEGGQCCFCVYILSFYTDLYDGLVRS